jgi:hypothetical protein
MEDDECPNPREEQNQREGKKQKPHDQTPLVACHDSTLPRGQFGKRGSGLFFRDSLLQTTAGNREADAAFHKVRGVLAEDYY